jgi:hypothetical protein
VRHGHHVGEEDLVHVSEATFIRSAMVRLCMTSDPDGGLLDGPYLLVGGDEHTLDEASALVDVLARLLDRSGVPTPRAGSGTRSPGP